MDISTLTDSEVVSVMVEVELRFLTHVAQVQIPRCTRIFSINRKFCIKLIKGRNKCVWFETNIIGPHQCDVEYPIDQCNGGFEPESHGLKSRMRGSYSTITLTIPLTISSKYPSWIPRELKLAQDIKRWRIFPHLFFIYFIIYFWCALLLFNISYIIIIL